MSVFLMVFYILAVQSVSFGDIFAGFERMVKSMPQNYRPYHSYGLWALSYLSKTIPTN